MPLPPLVKDCIKDLGKVFAVRLKRPKKNGPRQRSSTTTESFAREASDMAQLALPLVQAVASAIPLVGGPVQAAIGGLLTGLQAIDRRNQNKADLNSLILRLDRLSRELCNALPASDPVEQSRRDSFVRMLQDTSARVTALRERCLASAPITQAIAGCFVDIDRYLAEYLWSSQMQSQRDIREMLVILQREQEDRQSFLMTIEGLVTRAQSSVGPTATQLIGTATRGCVTLVDATGHEYPIAVDFCTSFEQFNEMLKVLFKCNSIEAQIQRRYMESEQYDLCIDESTQVTRLTSNEWSRLEVGTKVVMRIIIQEQMTSSSGVSYKCPCGAVNTFGAGSIMYSLERQAGSSIDCRKCKRRFQISRVSSREKQSTSTRSSSIDSDHTTDAGMDLIRNFHIQQSEVLFAHSLDEVFQCMWTEQYGLHCNSLVFGHDVAVHLRKFHGVHGPNDMVATCSWGDCNRKVRIMSLSRHIRSAHLGLVYVCSCGRIFTRRDGLKKHKITTACV